MSVVRKLACAVLAFAVAGCQVMDQISSSDTKKPVAKLSDDLAAAVFRYQFAHNASGRQDKASVYCIGYGSNPGSETIFGPSPKLLRLLAGIKPHVAAYTACAIDPSRGVVEKSTGGDGLLFKIATVSCSTMKRCIVQGGYYESSLSASANAYFLKKRDQGWIVVGDKDNFAS